MRKDELSEFENAYTESIKKPEKFWFTAAQKIDWFKGKRIACNPMGL